MKPLVVVAMLLVVAPFGLPFENTWFSGFFAGITLTGVLVSAVVSMKEPTEESGPAYVWVFRFGHSLFHLGTAYFAHPSLWRYFKDPRGERRSDEAARERQRPAKELFQAAREQRAAEELEQ